MEYVSLEEITNNKKTMELKGTLSYYINNLTDEELANVDDKNFYIDCNKEFKLSLTLFKDKESWGLNSYYMTETDSLGEIEDVLEFIESLKELDDFKIVIYNAEIVERKYPKLEDNEEQKTYYHLINKVKAEFKTLDAFKAFYLSQKLNK